VPYFGEKNAQCIYWDEEIPCFGLRVYPAGRRAYVVTYRVNHRKRLAKLGRADALPLAEARRKARTFLGQVADGEDPQAADDALRTASTVKSLVETYLRKHAKPKKQSGSDDERYLNNHLVPKLGSRLAVTITSADIAEIHSVYGADHPYAANRFLEIVRKMYHCAPTWGIVPKGFPNPCTGIEEFLEHKRKVYVTGEQMPALARAIEAEMNDYARHALWLLLLIGVRKKELLRAQWSDVDWGQRTLSIGRTKNGEPLLAPLSLAAIERLEMIPRIEGNPHILCGKFAGHPLKDLRSAWARVKSAAGLPHVRIHDLRRTVGSWLVQSGASLHLVGAVLNHKDPKTTAGYAYFQTVDRQIALDRHGERLQEIASRPNDRPEVNGQDGGAFVSSVDCRVHRFTRQELYDLVWSQPMSVLATSYGVSDSGLAKVCRRANIPVPPRGYWAKLTAGQAVQRPLLDPTLAVSNEIVIKSRAASPPANPGSTRPCSSTAETTPSRHDSAPRPDAQTSGRRCRRFKSCHPDQ
jgi:integrase